MGRRCPTRRRSSDPMTEARPDPGDLDGPGAHDLLPSGDAPTEPSGALDPHFEALLVYLREQRGFDFTGYKRPSLVRRVRRRMADVGIASVAEYQDYLEVHPEEFTPLFNTVLINVTSFFRDQEAWDHLRDRLLPEVLAAAGPTIRVWSAGCASGQEAYSLAILLAGALGAEQFRQRVDRKSTRLNSSHANISYAVFCLKKKHRRAR